MKELCTKTKLLAIRIKLDKIKYLKLSFYLIFYQNFFIFEKKKKYGN